MRRALSVGLLWLLTLASAGHARQDPAQPPATFVSGVDVVLVDVSVLDRDRRPVRGLAVADFKVLEDGSERPIVAFNAIDLPGPPAAAAPWMRDVDPDVTANVHAVPGRLVTILMDRTIRPQSVPAAQRVAHAVIDALGADDRAAVIFTGSGAAQNFTADRSLLRAAIERPFTGLNEADRGNPGQCFCGVCSLEAMTNVAELVREVPQRRKILLFIGDTVATVDWNYPAPIQVDCRFDIKRARERLEQAARTASLTIHAIDPRGLEVGSASASDAVAGKDALADSIDRRQSLTNRHDDLRVLADIGGGRAILNTNAPEVAGAALLDETSSYYVLGFRSANVARDGRFHPIRVTVNRSGATVQARQGYYAPRTAAAVSEATGPLRAMLDDLLPRTGLDLRVTTAPFQVKGKAEAAVVVTLGVHEAADGQPRHGNDETEILISAFQTDGQRVGSLTQTASVTAPPGGGAVDYDLPARLDLKPGRYELRLAARSRRAGRAGTVYTFVDVPDFARASLSMSGVLLGTPALRGALPRALGDLVPITPVARRSFVRGEQQTVFFRVYQAGGAAADAIPLKVRVVDAATRAAFDQAVTLAPGDFVSGGADCRLDLPTAQFPNGEYLLTAEATRNRTTVRRAVRFTVR